MLNKFIQQIKKKKKQNIQLQIKIHNLQYLSNKKEEEEENNNNNNNNGVVYTTITYTPSLFVEKL